jgi:hypothetical protein
MGTIENRRRTGPPFPDRWAKARPNRDIRVRLIGIRLKEPRRGGNLRSASVSHKMPQPGQEKDKAVSPALAPAGVYRRSMMSPRPRSSTATTVLHRVP